MTAPERETAPSSPAPMLALVPPRAGEAAASAAAAPRERQPIRLRVGLRVLVPGAAVLILGISQFLAAYLSEAHSRNLLVGQLEARLASEARELALAASTSMLDDFPELRLVPTLREFTAGHTDSVFAVVLDRDGRLCGHADPRQIGQPFRRDPAWKPLRSEVPLRAGEQLLGDDRQIVFFEPVRHVSGAQLGTVIVAFPRLTITRAIEHSRRQQWLLVWVVMAVGAVCMAVLMSRVVAPVAGIRRGLEQLGRGELGTYFRPYGTAEFRLLSSALNDMTSKLRDAQKSALDRERMAGELATASHIQQRLLPTGQFRTGDFVVAGAQRAAAEVGGDYYDFLTRPDGRVLLLMADVSGKGVAGALFMSMLASLVRAFSPRAESPARLLVTLEEHLGPHLPRGAFVTTWCGLLDPGTGQVDFASAGHVPTLVVRRGGESAEWFGTRAVPLGIAGPAGLARHLEDVRLDLQAGDLLLQLTDGITEAPRGTDGEQFGTERFEQVVRRHARSGPDAVVRAVFDAVSEWTNGPARDDETILVVARVTGPADGETPPAIVVDDLIEDAQAHGCHLELAADLSRLDDLLAWAGKCPGRECFTNEQTQRIELALYELCANIVEHGYRRTPGGRFDLWYVPPAGEGPEVAAPRRTTAEGFFLIRDQGRAFDPGRGATPDLRDPQRRRRGRGLGLEIARRTIRNLRYFPSTEHGNLTLIRFGDSPTPEGELDGNAHDRND